MVALIILTRYWTDGDGTEHAPGDAIHVPADHLSRDAYYDLEGRYRQPAAWETSVRAGDKGVPLEAPPHPGANPPAEEPPFVSAPSRMHGKAGAISADDDYYLVPAPPDNG